MTATVTVEYPGDDDDPDAVTVGREDHPVADDGTVKLPLPYARTLALRYGVPLSAIRVDICREVKDDGEMCGRELPCQYHTEGE